MSQRRPVHAVRFEDVEAFHHHGGGAGGVPGDMVLDLDLVVPAGQPITEGNVFGACCFAGKLRSPAAHAGRPHPAQLWPLRYAIPYAIPYGNPYARHPRTPSPVNGHQVLLAVVANSQGALRAD